MNFISKPFFYRLQISNLKAAHKAALDSGALYSDDLIPEYFSWDAGGTSFMISVF